jgi:hypothetical protein
LLPELCKSSLSDGCQQERHSERKQDIRDEKEQNFFDGQNTKK